MQTIVQHLNHIKNDENLRVTIVEEGNAISVHADDSDATFDIEQTEWGFLVGLPPMLRGQGQTQVTNEPRSNLDLTTAVSRAVSWMRRFNA
jgi:hypothetical protein